MKLEKAKIYDETNPQIWEMFEKVTLDTITKGFKNYSAKGIFELIRWHSGVSAKDGVFKINNNYTPYYARRFMAKYPKHNGFFRTKIVHNLK